MEHYSEIKTNDLSSHVKTRRKLKCILLNERSQSGKGYILYDSNYTISVKGKTTETVKRSVIARSWGEEGTNRWSKGNF